jgi:hypothetical protein
VGFPVGLILFAVGAVLAFAVNREPDATVNVQAVGWVLMAVGLASLLLSLLWWEGWGPGSWSWGQAPYDEPVSGTQRRRLRRAGRRRTVVEEEAGPGPPGLYDAPPPP